MPKVELFDKNEVLDKALALFWQKGYNGTSIRDLEQATGLGKSSIYNSFGDKEALFFETLKHYLDTDRVSTSGSLINAASPLKAIHALFENVYQCSINNKENKGCIMINCTTELAANHAKAREFVTDNKNTMLHLLKDLILKAQKQGEISKSKDAGELALYLFSSLQGYRVTSILVKNKKELRAILDTTLNSLIN